MPRYFVGVMVPEELKGYIGRVSEGISKLPIRCKFVETQNLHICLSFLGEIDERKVKEVSDFMDMTCENMESFDFSIGDMQIIPNDSYVRVIALECSDESRTSEKIMESVNKRFGGDSHHPHMTLCRVKSIQEKQPTIEKLRGISTEEMAFTASSIDLIRSDMGAAGPVYTVIHSTKLR
jgi:2'-5' RNA ligase